MGTVVYDFDELGRPIVADMVRDGSGRLTHLRTSAAWPISHDWCLGERAKPRNPAEARLAYVLRNVYKLSKRLGLPKYVMLEAARLARKVNLRYLRNLELAAMALLKYAANEYGMCLETGWEVNRVARKMGLRIVNDCSSKIPALIKEILGELCIKWDAVYEKAIEYSKLFMNRKAAVTAASAVILALRHYGIVVHMDEVRRITGTSHAVSNAISKVARVKIGGTYYAEWPWWLK